MSLDKHLNLLYSGTTPLNLGDRYYSQDLIRDLLYSWDNAGQIARRIGGDFPMLLMGGVVTAGAGAHCLDITEAWGICNYSVEHPDTFAALPPSKTSSDIVRIVHAASQNELDTSALDTPATADGATPNYVKLRYTETNGNTRTRAHAAGTYSYEVVPSYEYYCDAVAPTDYDVLLATVTITAMGVVTVTSSEVSYNMKDIQDDLDTAEAAIDVIQNIVGTAVTKSIPYTVLDNDTYNRITCDTLLAHITLPTASANTEREIEVINGITTSGLIKVIPEGAEKINYKGTDLTSFFPLFMYNDRVKLKCNGTKWFVMRCNSNYISGGRNTNDWTNRHLGFAVIPYDTKSAAVDFTGLTLTEETSGHTAAVYYDDGGTGASGNLYVYNCAGGTNLGYFTNNKTLTMSSGATALVNTATTTKVIDTDCYHGLGIYSYLFNSRMWASPNSAFSWVAANELFAPGYNNSTGLGINSVDTSNIRFQSGANGIRINDDSGTEVLYDTEDYSYNIMVSLIV